MAIQTTGITTSLVAATIGQASSDVGTLCSSTKINKWSKNKPVKYNTTSPITDAQRKSANYGIIIPQYTDADSILADTTSVWQYDQPTGGTTQPFRIGDFRGYEHSSVVPFDILMPNSIEVGSSGNLIKLRQPSVINGNLTLNDLFTNVYFGVAIKKGTQIKVKTTSAYIAAGENNLSIDDCGFLTENSSIIISCFLTNQLIASWTSVADQALFGLNAIANYSNKTINVYTRAVNTYTLGAGGFAIADRTALSFNNDLSHAGDRVTRTAVAVRALVNVYELISVTGRATRASDNAIIKEVNIPLDYQSSPSWLEVEFSGMNITFNTANGGVEDGLPTLDPSDYYKFSWTFNFQMI